MHSLRSNQDWDNSVTEIITCADCTLHPLLSTSSNKFILLTNILYNNYSIAINEHIDCWQPYDNFSFYNLVGSPLYCIKYKIGAVCI